MFTIALAMFFNLSLLIDKNSDISLLSLNGLATANAESGGTAYYEQIDYTSTSTRTYKDEDGKICTITTTTTGVDCEGMGSVDCSSSSESTSNTSCS